MNQLNYKLREKINLMPIPLKIVLSFLLVIFLGSFFLSLDLSQLPSSQATYFDHLFTTVSMVCVTGLYTQPVFTTYNLIGQIICIGLMKLGGLGLITVVTALFFQFRKNVSIRNERTVQEQIGLGPLSNFSDFIVNVVKYTSLIEIIGALLLMTHFIPKLGSGKGVFSSIFIAISAFNNAGFDNLGADSFQRFATVPIINFTIPLLVILGGIGFVVWFDLANSLKQIIQEVRTLSDLKRSYKGLTLHTRLVINWTLGLLFIGTLVFLLLEWNNPHTIGNAPIVDKLQIAWFQSAIMRTAGFASISFINTHTASIILFLILMFIGGSPGGTAGGAKTSTVAVVWHMILAEIRGYKLINYQKHTIEPSIARGALVVIMMFLLFFLSGIFLLSIFDEQVPLNFIMFEVISALATVGVTADLTPNLTPYSQSVLMVLMFVGRLGPITVIAALRARRPKNQNVRYAEGKVIIG